MSEQYENMSENTTKPLITNDDIAEFEKQQTQNFVDEYNKLCKRFRRAVGSKPQIVDGKIVAVNTVEMIFINEL